MGNNKEAKLTALSSHPLLDRLSDEQLVRFAELGDLEHYNPQETIVTEGSLGDSIYLIISGNTVVYKEGTGKRSLAALGPGDFFGEMSLVEATTRCASVVSVDDVEVFRIPNQTFHLLALEDPKVMNAVLVAVIRVLSERLRKMNEMIASVGQLSDWLSGSLV
jgi:CRP-like cAMP-binding protein